MSSMYPSRLEGGGFEVDADAKVMGAEVVVANLEVVHGCRSFAQDVVN